MRILAAVREARLRLKNGREKELREQIAKADIERGIGAMSGLSRGSILIAEERVFLGSDKQRALKHE